MTNDELLAAVSNIINPLRDDMQGIKGDIRELKQEVKGLKQEFKGLKQEFKGFEQKFKGFEQKFKGLEQEVKGLKQEVQQINIRVKKIELIQENEILPRLNTIEACYISTYDRYRDSIDDFEIMKQDISVLKRGVLEHSEKLQKIG